MSLAWGSLALLLPGNRERWVRLQWSFTINNENPCTLGLMRVAGVWVAIGFPKKSFGPPVALSGSVYYMLTRYVWLLFIVYQKKF